MFRTLHLYVCAAYVYSNFVSHTYFHFFASSQRSTIADIPYTIYSYIPNLSTYQWWCSWLRHCATSRQVAGSIPDGVIGIFHSGRTMALELTQPVTEMSTRNISWGVKRPVLRADNLTTFLCRLPWNLGASTFWNPQYLSRPIRGLLYLYLRTKFCISRHYHWILNIITARFYKVPQLHAVWINNINNVSLLRHATAECVITVFWGGLSRSVGFIVTSP